MSRLRMAAGAACCIVALSSVQAAASEAGQCWQSYEVEAAKVRDLHIMLMLGTLRCKAVNKEIEGKYSAFLDKQSQLLSSYDNVLKTRFMRVNGISDGSRAFEDFNTRLGNSHSGLTQAGSYCQMTDTLLTLAAEAKGRELPQLARNFSESKLGIDAVCEAAAAPAVAAAAPVAEAAAPVAIEAAAPVTAEAAAPVVTETAAPHEAITAAGVATAKAEAAAPEPASAVAALEAAAVALQNAAASLKAQQTAPAAAAKAEKPAVAAPEAKPALLQPVASAAPAG